MAATAAVRQQRSLTDLPYDSIPEMLAPPYTVLTKAPLGYTRDLEMRDDAPYFNGSAYCNKINLRFSIWLRHPATSALIRSLSNYYREAAHQTPPAIVMQVKSGARAVHGYYVHTMLHDALSAWCDFELLSPASRPRLPLAPSLGSQAATNPTATFVYTLQTSGMNRTETQDRIASVIQAVRGGLRSA